MPFTPFHFGAHACAALPLSRRINLIVFILANVVIDIEPLMVMTFNFSYPLHGYAHTLLIGGIIGAIWGFVAYQFKSMFERMLKVLKLSPVFSLNQYVISGICGVWLHVVFDSCLYTDIRPFFPLNYNPFYGYISNPGMHKLSALLFIPAMLLYFKTINRYKKSNPEVNHE